MLRGRDPALQCLLGWFGNMYVYEPGENEDSIRYIEAQGDASELRGGNRS